MKILNQKREGNLVEFSVEVDNETHKRAEQKAWTQAAAELKVPGFRPGKAPRSVLEKYINLDYLKEQTLRQVINEVYPKALKEAGIEPIDYPKAEPKDGSPLVINFKVEVLPEIKLGKYTGLKVKQKGAVVTEEEVEQFINNLRDRQATYHPVADRPLKSGDLVQLDMKAKLGEAEFAPFSRAGMSLLVGAGQIYEAFDEQILGLSIENNKQFKVAFPKEHKMAEIAEKEIEFDVTVKKISEKKQPELDDEFAKKMGSGSAADFRNEIKAAIENRKKTESEEVLKNDLIDLIEKESSMEVPAVLTEREIDTMVSELRRSLESQGLKLDNYLKNIGRSPEDMRADLKERAVKRVKNKLVLEEIAKKEKIEVSDIDLEVELRAIGRESGQAAEEVRKSMGEGVIEYIKDYLLRRKALDFVVASAKITNE